MNLFDSIYEQTIACIINKYIFNWNTMVLYHTNILIQVVFRFPASRLSLLKLIYSLKPCQSSCEDNSLLKMSQIKYLNIFWKDNTSQLSLGNTIPTYEKGGRTNKVCECNAVIFISDNFILQFNLNFTFFASERRDK